MDPHRSWPHQPAGGPEQRGGATFGSNMPPHQSQHSPPSTSGGPSHPGASYSSYHSSQHGLANLAGLSQSSPRQGQMPRPDMQSLHPPGPGYTLPGIGPERDRERARELEHLHMQEEEERRHREERQRIEQGPPMQSQQGPPTHIHQPVAVGPRTVHGPNGLLGNPGMTAPLSHSQIGAPS